MSGVWLKQGVVLVPNSGDLNGGAAFSGTSNSTVLYEGSPQIISPNPDGNVFKIWFQGGNNCYYAESNDGVSWTRHGAAILSGLGIGQLAHFGSTYYFYVSTVPTAATWTTIQAWTSPDGINFTLANATALSINGAGWDSQFVLYLKPFVKIGGTYFASYFGQSLSSSGLGIATSTDLLHWTNGASNLSVGFGAGNIHLINGTYWFWSGIEESAPASSPADLARSSSTDLATWTSPIITLPRSLQSEGSGTAAGAMAAPSLVELNGKSYIFYTGTPHEPDGVGYQIMLATANVPLASLVQGTEGLEIGFVQSPTPSNFAAATSFTSAFASNNASGNLLVCVAYAGAAVTDTLTIADTQGNTWLPEIEQFFTQVNPNDAFIRIWIAPRCKAGPNTVTVTSGSTVTASIVIAEYTGVNSLDVKGSAFGSSGTLTGPSLTATKAAAIEVAVFVNFNGTIAAEVVSAGGLGTSVRQNVQTAFAYCDNLQYSVVTFQPTATGANSGWAVGAMSLFNLSKGSAYAFEA